MDLCVDIGNTRLKAHVFNQGALDASYFFEGADPETFRDWLLSHTPFDRAILSSVKNHEDGLLKLLKKRSDFFMELHQDTPVPFSNYYRSKESLGKDRIALLAGADFLFPSRNVLIVDIGTAITYDLLHADGAYYGGNIAPGPVLRFKSLHQYTDKLPLKTPAGSWLMMGDTTDSAVESGVLQGIIFEMEGYIAALSALCERLVVVLTGGDSVYFDKKIKYPIFAYPDLLAGGLYRILDFNAQHP